MSLAWELEELLNAVVAAQILVEQLAHEGLDDPHSAEYTAPAVASVLTLVECRLKDLRHVLSGDLDPAKLIGRHNQKKPPGSEQDPDVYLRAWPRPKGTKI